MAENVFGWVVRDDLPDPAAAPELFDGLLTRRVMAFVIDTVLMTVLISIAAVVLAIAGVLTLGIAWLGYFVLVPAVIVFYYATTLGSPMRATPGMKAMDVVLTPTRTKPLDGMRAILHPLVFWVTIWAFWPLLLLGLFTARRQLMHDLIVGTLMVRRSPMERHWNAEAPDHPMSRREQRRYT
ncbi:MAG: RDD family protein [Cucumibacter sp.]